MRKTQIWTSELGTGANAPLDFIINGAQPFLKAVQGYRDFAIETLTGSVRVKGSLNGSDFADQLVLSHKPTIAADAIAVQNGTFVAVTTAGTMAFFYGDFRAIRVEQVGATAAQVRILGAGDE